MIYSISYDIEYIITSAFSLGTEITLMPQETRMENITMQSVHQEETLIKIAENALDKCPVDHKIYSGQKAHRDVELGGLPIERGADGTWYIRGFEEARAVLRNGNTKQAGFKAEVLAQMRQIMNSPVLYMDGKPHQQQRKQIARFFAPKTVSASYRQMMETLTDQLIDELKRKKRLDLSQMSLKLAVRVA